MRYVDEFRDPALITKASEEIRRVADPARLIPIGGQTRIVHGTRDDRVPCAMSRDYTAAAVAAGDEVTLDELPGCGHFELIDPLSAAWPTVLAAFRAVAPPSGS